MNTVPKPVCSTLETLSRHLGHCFSSCFPQARQNTCLQGIYKNIDTFLIKFAYPVVSIRWLWRMRDQKLEGGIYGMTNPRDTVTQGQLDWKDWWCALGDDREKEIRSLRGIYGVTFWIRLKLKRFKRSCKSPGGHPDSRAVRLRGPAQHTSTHKKNSDSLPGGATCCGWRLLLRQVRYRRQR